MKAFISACVVAIMIAGIGFLVLNSMQVPANVAFRTDAVRLGS